MYIELSEQEAHVCILKGLGLDLDAKLQKRGDLHVLTTPHQIVIKLPGEGTSIFRPEVPEVTEIPDDCFVVDGVNDNSIAEMEDGLDGT